MTLQRYCNGLSKMPWFWNQVIISFLNVVIALSDDKIGRFLAKIATMKCVKSTLIYFPCHDNSQSLIYTLSIITTHVIYKLCQTLRAVRSTVSWLSWQTGSFPTWEAFLGIVSIHTQPEDALTIATGKINSYCLLLLKLNWIFLNRFLNQKQLFNNPCMIGEKFRLAAIFTVSEGMEVVYKIQSQFEICKRRHDSRG